jgi:hypothetical protein
MRRVGSPPVMPSADVGAHPAISFKRYFAHLIGPDFCTDDQS